MVTLETLSYLSTAPDQFIDITEDVHAAIERSSVTNGLAAIILSHTTCGIVVNEGLPCVETDLMETLDRIAPLDAPLCACALPAELWSHRQQLLWAYQEHDLWEQLLLSRPRWPHRVRKCPEHLSCGV